jgi:hypothetical protein
VEFLGVEKKHGERGEENFSCFNTFAKWASPKQMKPSLGCNGKKGKKKKNAADE